MDKTINGKIYHIPNNEIEYNMKTLQISEEEAIELWLSDNDIITDEELEELDSKAKKVKIDHGAKSTDTKEKKPKEKKINPIKQSIIAAIAEGLKNLDNINQLAIRNNEKYIDFTIDSIEYTINLVAHRTKK